MPDAKISSLIELAEAPASTDEFVIVDKSDTTMAVTGTTKKITKQNALGAEIASITALQSVVKPASSANPAYLELKEDTDNGTNKITVTAPSAIASDNVLTLPDETGTVLSTASSGIVDLLRADGWVSGDAMTYASATTFTVAGDKTAKYTKGTKIKLTNGTVKYFYVVSSSFSSVTTVTVTGEVDLANSAITSPFYSYIESPQGFKRGEMWYQLSAIRSTPQTINNNSLTTVLFDIDHIDTNNNFNTGNGKYTVPIKGVYKIHAELVAYDENAKITIVRIDLYKNSSEIRRRTYLTSSLSTLIIAGVGELLSAEKGDTFEIKIYIATSDSGTAVISDNSSFTVQFISI